MADPSRDAVAAPYRFHAFEVSYFSGKVRPALRYKGLWYEERRADLGEIQRRTGLGFVPIVVTPEGETWQDTTEILERLEARHPIPPLFPSSPVQRIAAHLVELYTDEFALLPAMHYRWGSELGEATARARFEAMIGNAKLAQAVADRMAAGRIALGATDETAAAIEAHTRDLLDALSALFEGQPYLLGGRMSLADCALMGPLYGHFFNDLVSRRLLLETAVPVVGWIERCNFPGPDRQGEWAHGDALAPAFRSALAVMGRDAAPLILDTVRAVEAWADGRPAGLEELPRAAGRCDTSLRGTSVRRVAQVYSLWMLQHTLDAHRALEPAQCERVNEELEGTGWEDVLAYSPRHRLAKRRFQLVFE